MIRFKDDARPVGIWHSRELRRALPIVQEVWREFGQRDVIVTCGPEGEHSAGSLPAEGAWARSSSLVTCRFPRRT